MDSPTTTLNPAGFWLRVGAKFCDTLVLGAAQLLLIGLFAALDAFATQPAGATLAVFAATVLLQIGYFAVGNAGGRRTLGYRVAGLGVRDLRGEPLSLSRSLWRSLLSTFALNFLIYGGFLDFLAILFGAQKRTAHDFASRSRVICAEKSHRGALWGLPALLFTGMGLWASDVIFPSALRAYYIPAGSMEPTLRIEDRLLVNLLTYRFRAPRNGEIAVFKAPRAAPLNGDTQADVDFIKRVVGTPGQAVEMTRGVLRVDGAIVSEPYVLGKNEVADFSNLASNEMRYDLKIVGGVVYSRNYYGSEPESWTRNGADVAAAMQPKISVAKPGRVPADQFLMLGDHRSNSNDSHVWGFASRGAFIGPAMNKFWPQWTSLR